MNTIKIFLLDANVFIEAKRRYYAFDLCPGFWESLIWNYRQNRILSINQVKKELEDGKDELSKWITSKMPLDCFISTNTALVSNWFGKMQAWVQGQSQFLDEAKAEFAAKPDCWLVAYAKANDFILVTQEVLNPAVRRKIPIPNVCKAFDVDYIDTFGMLKTLGVKFVLK